MLVNPLTGNSEFNEYDIEVYRSAMPLEILIVFIWRFNGESCAKAFEVYDNAFDRDDWNVAYEIAEKFSQQLVTYLSAIYRTNVKSNSIFLNMIASRIIEVYGG
ncbi:hypothetical protein AKUA2103_PHAGE100240 (plasmid) [Apilactobacillus kunkeei]|nr:hypothetical protein AKUA2103_PHAGE100240 [Apilactobacillus kunkeei]CAI2699391.1 hypothetical protein AKUA1003_PHAGE100240 [Apilactobacillus kunkeei]